MILKTKDRELEVSFKLKNVKKIEDTICDEDESLLTKLPSITMAKGSIEILAKIIHIAQYTDEKLPLNDDDKYDVYDFIDDVIEYNETSVMDIFLEVIKELDIRGAFKKGLGFQMASMITEAMDKAIEDMKNKDLSLETKE